MPTLDKLEIARRFGRSAGTYAENADVQRDMAHGLVSEYLRISGERKLTRVLEIGPGPGTLTDLLAEHGVFVEMTVLDLSGAYRHFFEERPGIVFREGDMECVPFPENLSGVFSNAALQWAEDPAKLFRKIHDSLCTGGFFVFGTFGPDNFLELRRSAGTGLMYPDCTALRTMLEPMFCVEHLCETRSERHFGDIRAMLLHLRRTGVGRRTHDGRLWTAGRLAELERVMRSSRPDGELVLTYHPILCVARRKD